MIPGTAQKPRSRTYASLDLWRGFAAIWVVLFHGLTSIEHSNVTSLRGDVIARFFSWGDAGVHLFFVVSGFCIAAAGVSTLERGQSAAMFLKARARRIFPTYWVSLSIVLILMILATYVQHHGFVRTSNLASVYSRITPASLAANILLIQTPLHLENVSVVAWTLCFELAFYGVVALMILVFARYTGSAMLKGLHLVTLATLVLSVFAPQALFFPFTRWICFGVGVLLFDFLCMTPWRERAASEKRFYGTVLTAIATLFVAQIIHRHGDPLMLRDCIGVGFAALLYLLRPFDAKIARAKAARGLLFAGTMSYSLYLIHFPVVGGICQIALRMRFPTALYGVELVLMLLSSLAVAYVFYRLVESRFVAKKSAPKAS